MKPETETKGRIEKYETKQYNDLIPFRISSRIVKMEKYKLVSRRRKTPPYSWLPVLVYMYPIPIHLFCLTFVCIPYMQTPCKSDSLNAIHMTKTGEEISINSTNKKRNRTKKKKKKTIEAKRL